jgi:DNA polymerase (family X)
MINLELSTILTNLAEINKSKNDDLQTVMDLTGAARTIRDYPGFIEEAYSAGILENIPGIDRYSFELIKEYFEKGKISEYEKIKTLYSDDLISFVRMSGLGKRRIFKIYEILQVSDIDDLKDKLIDKGSIKYILDYPDLGKDFINPIHIERMLETVKYFEKIRNFTPRGYIENLIDRIKGGLSEIKEIAKIEVVGSLRRKKSFIRDIDILVLPEFNLRGYDKTRSKEIIKKIKTLKIFKELKEIDERFENISARFESVFGIDVEIVIGSAARWPLDLIYTTGSKRHLEKLELEAINKGLFDNSKILIPASEMEKLSKDGNSGIRTRDNNLMREENLVYEMLGMQYIPPELREGFDEVELAKSFKLPKLVNIDDIRGDLHIHSQWSDGLISISDIVEKSKKNNYEYIAISDHSMSNKYGNGLDEKRIIEKFEYIKKIKSEIKEINLLMGGEVDIKASGKLDYDDEILEKMDIVLASMHSNFVASKEENTNKVLSAIENRNVDVIAHPTGVVFGSRAPYSLDMDKIIESAAKNDKAMEINSYFLRLDLNEDYSKMVKSCGGRVVINTDSHRPGNMDMIRFGVDVARRAGLEKEDILNTISLKDLMSWKKERGFGQKL